MSKVHSVVSMKVKEGNEQAYLDWLQDDAPVLARVFARTGIHGKVVLTNGPYVLAHYEADTSTAVGEAFQTPEAVAMGANPNPGFILIELGSEHAGQLQGPACRGRRKVCAMR